jgi:hypothetical protein
MSRTSKDIIRNIASIYEELKILPNVREHQARVAGVIMVCKEHWKPNAPAVNWDDAIAAALLHDLGNIAKAKMDTEFGQTLLGPVECERIEHWLEVQRQAIAKYGADEYAVTQGLLARIDAPPRLWNIISGARFRYNEETLKTDDIERLLVATGDHRVGPFGVLTLAGRLEEGQKRYGHKQGGTSMLRNAPLQSAYDIARRVETYIDIHLDSITEDDVRPFVQRFLALDERD